MAENTVDTLKIRVNVDTGNSTKDLGKVVSAITQINRVASDKSLSKYSKSMSALASASKGLFALPRALEKIENLQISPKLKENLDKIASASEKLGIAGKGVKTFSDSLKKITKMGEDTELDKKFDAVSTSVGTFANSINQAVSDDTLKRLERLANALDKITQNANKKIRGGLIKQVANPNKAVNSAIAWQSIENIFKKINSVTSDVAKSLFDFGAGITKDLDRAMGGFVKHIPVLGELTSAWRNYANDVRKIVTSNAGVIDKASELIIARLARLMSVLYSFVKLPFNNVGLTKGMASLLALPFKGFVDSIKDLTKSWNKFSSSLARIAIYRAIRTILKEITSAVKEGVNNLYLWAQAWKDTYATAERFANTMDTLATGVLYLKNSIGAMVSPLLDYLAPALDLLIDKFVALTNAINQAIATLTGAGLWRKAIRYPVEYGDVMSGAKKKADDLKRTVLGFDELNRLDDNKKKSGGGGQDDWDYSKMFEEVPVADNVRAMIEAENWGSIGSLIASKINQSLASINWNSIKRNTKKWAVRFGSLFNSVLLDTSMPLVGKSIAELLNTVSLGVNTFFGEFDFVEFGKHLSDGFTSFINNAEWNEWGKALSQKIGALIDTIYGFRDIDLTGLGDGITDLVAGMFENINLSKVANSIKSLLPKIGKELGIALNGVFTNANTALNRVDFKGLGRAFSRGINNMLKGIDPTEAGTFLTNGLEAVIEFVSGALNRLNWDLLNEKIGQTITAMFNNLDLNTAVGSAVEIAENIIRLLNTVINAIPWEKVGDAIASVDTSGIRDGLKKLFENVIGGLERAGVLDDAIKGLGVFLGLKLSGALMKLIPSILPAIMASSGMGGATSATAGGAGILASFGGIKGLLGMDSAVVMGAGTFGEIATFIGTGIVGSLVAWFGGQKIGNQIGKWLFPDDASYYDNFHWFGEGGLFEASLDFAKMKAEGFGTSIGTWADNFGATHGALFDSVTSKNSLLGSSFGALTGLITEDGDEIDLSVTTIKETFDLWSDTWATEHPLISAGFDAIYNTVKNSKIGSAWSGIMDSLSLKANSTLESLEQRFGKAFDFLTGGIKDLLKGTDDLNNTLGKGINSAPRMNVAMRASGGFVDKGDLFLAGEAGPEIVTSYGGDSAVMNMEQIISAISQSVAMASGGDITVQAVFDGDVIDKRIITAQQRQSLRSGR